MNAIEKLRDELKVCGCDPDECPGCEVPRKVREGLQAVEQEYMELPKDADGVPVRIGDKMTNINKPSDEYTVTSITESGCRVYGDCAFIKTSQLRHVKPDPLKELLRKFYLNARDVCDSNMGDLDEECAAYAVRIRELMEVER